MKIWHGTALVIPLFVVAAFSYASLNSSWTGESYGTWQSLEPDSWASVWLIRTHINPDAEITLRPAGSNLDVDVSFAVPGSRYVRDKTSSAFQQLLGRLENPEPSLVRMGEVIHGMESATWAFDDDEMPRVVEQAYRTLQDRFERSYVPITCYGQFFDTLHQAIADGDDPNRVAKKLNQTLVSIATDCDWSGTSGNGRVAVKEKNRVETVPVADVLEAIAAGQNVVFVDTRETQEYEESHIPGALNMKLREVNEQSVAVLKDADLVVSYCLKDFRGYEVARKLLHRGVETASVMDPHGYVAWRTLGLPITANGQPEAKALAELSKCAGAAEQCLKKVSIQ